jgi:uncharacterized membrane protein
MTNLKKEILLYLSTFGVFLLVDFIWIIFGAMPLYRAEVGGLLIDAFRIIPAFLTYIALVAGIFIFAINPSFKEGKFFKSIVLGSMFGFLSYSIFALTNYSVLEAWTFKLAVTDMVWGAVIGAIVGGIGYKLSVAFLK